MSVDEQGYNGWKNYETWAVKLWLDNDEGTYRYVHDEMVQGARDYADDHPNIKTGIWTEDEATRFALADALKTEIEDDAPEVEGMYADLLGAALSEVDWGEIAENILSAVAENV